MLEWAEDEANKLGLTFDNPIWVPGALEIPLSVDRTFSDETIAGSIVLGVIEAGETHHGLVIGQAVIKTLLELQLIHDKPIGIGIIGPGARKAHLETRLEKHARAAVRAVARLQ